jgi:hypothetical protein
VGVGWSPDKDGATEPLAVELPPVSVNRPIEKGGTTDPLAVEGPWVVGDRWMGRRVVVVEVLPVARDRLDPDKEAAELVVVELQHVAQLDPEHTSLLIGVAHVSVIGGSVCLARGRIGC